MAHGVRLVGVALILGTTLAAGRWTQAQAMLPPPAQSQGQPTVISGNDLGFRVDGRKGDTPIGTLVARVNGQWVEVGFSVAISRLTAR